MASERQGLIARALGWLKGGGQAPEADTPPALPARGDDPAFAPWASPSIMHRAGLRLPRAPWDGSGREDPDEEAARTLAVRASMWAEAPRAAAGLRLPRPSRADLEALWRDWPGLARAHRLPPAEEWEER